MQPGRRLSPPRLTAQLRLLLCFLHCPQQLLLAAAHVDAGVVNRLKVETTYTSIQAELPPLGNAVTVQAASQCAAGSCTYA